MEKEDEKPMVIQVDTRQQMHRKHHQIKERYFVEHGHEVVHSKLMCGDYALPSDGSVVVDTKQSPGELYSNLIQDHERFRAECVLAQKCGIKLVVLVENNEGFTKPDDIIGWKNPQYIRWYRRGKKGKPPAPNLTILKIMHSMTSKYGVEFRFCSTEDAGEQIISILTEEGKMKVAKRGMDKTSQEDS